jgi:hypothetical protein
MREKVTGKSKHQARTPVVNASIHGFEQTVSGSGWSRGQLSLAGSAGTCWGCWGERREGGRGGPDGSRSCSPRCKKQMQSSTAEAKQAREQAAVGLVFLLMISRLATTKGKSDRYSEHSRTLGPCFLFISTHTYPQPTAYVNKCNGFSPKHSSNYLV